MLSNTWILFQIWKQLIINTIIDDIENEIENLRLHECSLKNRFFWKLVIWLETYMKWSGDSNFRIMLYERLNLILKIQWTLSISTTFYLEYLSISNKMFSLLKFPPRTLHSLSLFRTSPSRTFPYIEQIFQSLEPFSLSISNI